MLIRVSCLLWMLLTQVFIVGAKFEHGSSSSSGKGNPNADQQGSPSAGRLWPIQSTGGAFMDGVFDTTLTQIRPPVRDPTIASLTRRAAFGRTEMWDFHAWTERIVRRPELQVMGMHVYWWPVGLRGLGLMGYMRVVWNPRLNNFKFEFTMNLHFQSQLRALWPEWHGKELISIDLYFGVYNVLNPYRPIQPGSRVITPAAHLRDHQDLGRIPYGDVRIRYPSNPDLGPQLITSRLVYDAQALWSVHRRPEPDDDDDDDDNDDDNKKRPRPPPVQFESRIGLQWYFVIGEGHWANEAPPLLLGPPDQGHHHHDPDPHGQDREVPQRPTTPPRREMSHPGNKRGRRRPPSPS